MKKKLTLIICVLAILVFALAGCSGDHYKKINVDGRQDTSYVVTSNGGTAVQYGNYVYFINGNRGYDDEEATSNIFGEVVKGGLYRAELVGEKTTSQYGSGVSDFAVRKSDETAISLVAQKTKNYKNDVSFDVDVELISPKTIGTKGYADGGIWIYDDCVYYASPANHKNKNGQVMDDYTAFFKAKLDGSETKEIYVSETVTESSPYAFYKYNGKVYLVVLESNDEGKYIKSVEASAKNPEKTEKTIAHEVQSVIFPTSPVYYNGISTNTVYDYIYIQYSGTEYYNNNNRSDVVLEYMRPDGSNGKVFAEGYSNLKLEAVRDDLLFYRADNNGSTVLKARDYSSLTSNFGYSETVLGASVLSSAKEIYPYATGEGSISNDRVGVIVSTQNSNQFSLYAYTNGGNTVNLIESGATAVNIQGVDENYIYYQATGSSVEFKSYDVLEDTSKVIITAPMYVEGFKVDRVGPYLVYMGELEGKFTQYTFFYDIAGVESFDAPIFVGARAEGETRSKIEKITIEQADLDQIKTQYSQGEELDVSGLVITLHYFRDPETGEAKTDRVEVEEDWVSNFSTASLSEALALTVTYKDEGDEFTAVYSVSIVE